MKLNHTYILLVGKSGSGKSAIARELEKLGYAQLQSYTTREPRYEGESGHAFISKREFLNLKDLVAYTIFDYALYGATAKQVGKSDVFIIDVPGIRKFLRLYEGAKQPLIVYVDVPFWKRLFRMMKRGDGLIHAIRRGRHDRTSFRN